MTLLQAILLGLLISGAIIGTQLGSFDRWWAYLKRLLIQRRERQKAKARDKIEYPLHLTNVSDIKKYIQKNEPQLPMAATWGPLLVAMIQELSAAGWHTEMPLYAMYEEGHALVYVLTDDMALQERFNAIIEQYEDTHR